MVVKRASFLRSIGRDVGNSQYQWLHRAMQALSFAMLVIEVKQEGKPRISIGHAEALHLIDGFRYDPVAETYSLRIDPRWKQMFNNREYALIDWERRQLFRRGQDMAKSLQRLIATSSNKVQRYALKWLKEKSQYGSPVSKFRNSLSAAIAELVRLNVIAEGRIEFSTKGEEQVVLIRLDSSA